MQIVAASSRKTDVLRGREVHLEPADVDRVPERPTFAVREMAPDAHFLREVRVEPRDLEVIRVRDVRRDDVHVLGRRRRRVLLSQANGWSCERCAERESEHRGKRSHTATEPEAERPGRPKRCHEVSS